MEKVKSVMMDALYGTEEAEQIYNMLNSIDAELNLILIMRCNRPFGKQGFAFNLQSFLIIMHLQFINDQLIEKNFPVF